jgi:hypothetical protein
MKLHKVVYYKFKARQVNLQWTESLTQCDLQRNDATIELPTYYNVRESNSYE